MATAVESPAMASKLNRARIRELRDAKGWTQLEAAKRAGLKLASRWSDIENGRKDKENIGLDTLYAVAEALGVMPCDLLLPPEKTKPGRKAKR